MNVTTAVTTLTLAAGGAVASAVTSLAQQASDGGSGIGNYVTGGGSAVAVTALAYVLKQFLAGNIVAKPVAEYLREQALMLAAMGEREERLMKIAEDAIKQQADSNRAIWKANEYLGGEDPRAHPRRAPK